MKQSRGILNNFLAWDTENAKRRDPFKQKQSTISKKTATSFTQIYSFKPKSNTVPHSKPICITKSCTGGGVGECLSACSLNYPACNAPPYCHLRPLWLHHIFRHYPINGTIFGGGELLNVKCVFWFSPQFLFETFLILRRIQRATVINVKQLRAKYSYS